MALSPTTLANQLAFQTPTGDENVAIQNLAISYIAFMSTATAGVVPIVPAALSTTPKSAMIAAMTGLSKNSSTAIQSGITAFWGAMVPLAATLFPTATLITPPATLSTLAASLTSVFLANTTAKLSLADAATAVASAIYTASLGGTATITVPPPTVVPII